MLNTIDDNKVYPVLYLDYIVVKCHQEKRVVNHEGSKFLLSVLTEMNN